MTLFGTLNPDGSVTDVRAIPQSTFLACPHFIMAPEHYRDDLTCRCNDATHEEMQAWGYTWNDETGRWS